ncbi:MAG: hypothetical protein M3Q52_10315 [Pseudomonadota bacterium]|nr:hypothetical protein [Pseudomonadota bacterium]
MTATFGWARAEILKRACSKRSQKTPIATVQTEGPFHRGSFRAVRRKAQVVTRLNQIWLIGAGTFVAVAPVFLAACVSGMGDTCPEVGGSREHCVDP